MKKFLAILLCLAMIGAMLASCDKGGKYKESDETSESDTESESVSDSESGNGALLPFPGFPFFPSGDSSDTASDGESDSDLITESDSDTDDGENTVTESQELEFVSMGDGTCYVSGIGTCWDAETIVIPEKSPDGDYVTYIGDRAFCDEDSIVNVIIGDGLTRIGNEAFYSCSRLKAVTFAENNNVESIGNSAFLYCDALTGISIPEGVTTIGNSAFYCCTGLTSVTIPNSVTSIGYEAFNGCCKLVEIYNLSYLNITAGSTENGHVGCYALNIYTPESGESKLWTDSDGFMFYEDGDVCYFMGYEGTKSHITLPADCNGKTYEIYAYAFCSYDYRIENVHVTIPDSVTSIGERAFAYFYKLTNITIGSGVTKIGDYAFYYCRNLKTITVPDSVTRIGLGVFDGCEDLFQIENGIHYVDKWVVGCDSSVTNAILRSDTIGIGDWVFRDHTELKSISIPVDLKFIGAVAFDGCRELTNVDFAENGKLTIIDRFAFRDCTKLTSITIPDGVKSIGDGAFDGCKGLTNITIPNSVDVFGEWIFSGCDSLVYTEYNNGKYLGNSENPYIVLAGVIDTSVTDFTISNTTRTIQGLTFHDCVGLTSITIPDGVTSICDSVFAGCRSLSNITIPDSVTRIGGTVFSGCKLLNIVYDGTMAEWSELPKKDDWSSGIGKYNIQCSDGNINSDDDTSEKPSGGSDVEDNNTSEDDPQPEKQGLEFISNGDGTCYVNGLDDLTVTDLIIPSISPAGDTVTAIGNSAFYNCTGLTSIKIPDSVTSIGYSAFERCTALTSVTIPDSVTSIDYAAFRGCTGLTSIAISDNVTSIGGGTFSGCTGLTSITIPDSVTSIGDSAFDGCTDLTSITIPDKVTSIGDSAFAGCTGLTSIRIPNGVTSIEKYTFAYCTKLTEVVMPLGVTYIGSHAFENCNILITYAGTASDWEAINKESSWNNGGSWSASVAPDDWETDTDTDIDTDTDTDQNEPTTGSFGLEFVSNGDGTCYVSGLGDCTDCDIVIPSISPNGDKVTAIGGDAFGNCLDITSVIIPDGVESIGDWAFSGCNSLLSISIPDSVTTIGSWVFWFCDELKDITFEGTKTQWSAITKGSDWNYGTASYTVTCTDGTLTKSES